LLYEAICNKNSLKFLNLRRCSLEIAGSEQLGLAIERCLLIETLYLDKNNIGDDGLYYILKGLTKCPKIKTLSLKDNKIGNKGCNNIKSYLESWKSSSLTQLYLDSNPLYISFGLELISLGLSKNKSLKVIGLDDVGFTGDNIGTFFKNIKNNQTLNSVFMGKNKVGMPSLKLINEISEGNALTTIKLENNLVKLNSDEFNKMLMSTKTQYYYSLDDKLQSI